MAYESLDPIGQLSRLGESSGLAENIKPAPRPVTGNLFEDMLGKAMDSLQGVSVSEVKANSLIHGYLEGKVDLVDVVTAVSELNFMVQLTQTVAQSAIQSFKEITSMQI